QGTEAEALLDQSLITTAGSHPPWWVRARRCCEGAGEVCRGQRRDFSRSAQACAHPRHASAQIRQCSCLFACCSHSSAQVSHTLWHVSITDLITAGSASVSRESTFPVARQMSAQSWFVRMQDVNSATMSSARHASAHAVQVCAHSKQAAIQAASLSLSTSPRFFG